ncbi:hypothetical protein [Desmospora profundinema]|uniref:StbC n=1 Tax=Desmospora profundinema TaxID=1571184 RepID=A0ABU1IL84_9BACL|nr:hypothetical protein [Desmospora profundinema]MDR6225456.1 hypothetical protein [Desmospora profundinema]
MRDGVVISHKEMFEAQQEVVKSLHRLESRMESRMDVLESKVEASIRADERSRKALEKAEGAMKAAKEARRVADGNREIITRLLVAVMTGLIGGAIAALFYFAQLGLGG